MKQGRMGADYGVCPAVLEAQPRLAGARRFRGLDPMYGPDGWCHSCGTPCSEQGGRLRLRRADLSPVPPAWVPNWRFDTICLEGSVAARLGRDFRIKLREVEWEGHDPGAAMQIVIPTGSSPWFDPEELRERAEERHGVDGASCTLCGTWRWMPLTFGLLPPLRAEDDWTAYDAIASPEWFGDGCQSSRQILLRRSLAEVIASLSPKDFEVRAIPDSD